MTKDLENYFKLHLLKFWSVPILVVLSSGCSPTTSPDTIKDVMLESLQQEIYTKPMQKGSELLEDKFKTVTYAFRLWSGKYQN